MRISSRAQYGVRALFDIALYGQNGPVPLKAIAARQHISEHYLEQLMAAMRKGRLVKSVRGAAGGYELVAAPEDITIGAILQVLEGPVLPATADETDDDSVEAQVTRGLWRHVAAAISSAMESLTLAHLLAEADELRVQSGAGMWHI